jgi:hypothetical protein
MVREESAQPHPPFAGVPGEGVYRSFHDARFASAGDEVSAKDKAGPEPLEPKINPPNLLTDRKAFRII